jgi:outer membrane protein OmpA-like peptidoglycan-associated protein
MKKILIFLFTYLLLSTAMSQEQGWFLSLSCNYGHNNFKYTLDNGAKSDIPLSWGAGISASYFWHRHWGFKFGAEWFDYNGQATYTRNWKDPNLYENPFGDPYNGDPTHFITNGMNAGWLLPIVPSTQDRVYDLRLSLDNWQEKQHGYIVNVPLMVEYQTKWGRKELVGMYAGLGVKLQIPVLSKTYSHSSGVLQVLGYFPSTDLTLGESTSALYNHGFGTSSPQNHPLFEGTFKMQPINVAAAGEFGFTFAFSRRVDFSVGVYLDYGILNMKKGNAHESGNLIMPNTNDDGSVNTGALDRAERIGDGLAYNGFLQSHVANRFDLFAFGAKATLRIKLDKLRDKSSDEELSDREFIKAQIDTTYTRQLAQAEKDRIFYQGLQQAMLDTIMEVSRPNPLYVGEWAADNQYSPNNPNNPNYAYPVWYTPDYLNDPVYKDRAGMNVEDEGPNNPESVQRNLDKVNDILNYMTESIYFDLGKSDLREASIEVLDRKVALMTQYPGLSMALVGHTCDLGGNILNDELSQNRCMAARNYMIRKGVRASRIDLVPMGKHHPDYPNNSEENRELNRRVDFIIVK